MARLFDRRLAWPAAFLVLAIAAAAHAQAKGNFTGEWKANISKSDYGPMPAPQTASMKIAHEDPSLKVSVKQTGERGESNWDMSYNTEGRESVNEVRGNPVKSIVKWDGDVLLFDSKLSFNGNDISLKDKWSLSEGGKVLTVERNFSSSQGEGGQKLIYEKQ